MPAKRITINDGYLTEDTVSWLLNAMKASGKSAYVDWDNCTITVTGDVMENQGVIMSDGLPLKAWPVILQIKEER